MAPLSPSQPSPCQDEEEDGDGKSRSSGPLDTNLEHNKNEDVYQTSPSFFTKGFKEFNKLFFNFNFQHTHTDFFEKKNVTHATIIS